MARVSIIKDILLAFQPEDKPIVVSIKHLKPYLWKQIYYPAMCNRSDKHEWGLKHQVFLHGNEVSQMHGYSWCRNAAQQISYGVSCKTIDLIVLKLTYI